MGSGSNCLPNQKTHRERLRQAPAEVRGVKGIIWVADLTSLIERVAEVASSGFPGLSTFWGGDSGFVVRIIVVERRG